MDFNHIYLQEKKEVQFYQVLTKTIFLLCTIPNISLANNAAHNGSHIHMQVVTA